MRRFRPPSGPPRVPPRTRCRPGFTLIELVIVLTIASVLVMIAAPSIDRTRLNVDTQESSVRSVFLLGQRLAEMRGFDVVVSIDTAGRLIYLHEDADRDQQVDSGERISAVELDHGVAFGRGVTPPLRTGLTSAISFSARENSRPAVVFHRDGSASESATFYLTSRRSSSATYVQDTRAFDLQRATGHLVAYRYDGSAWQRER